MSTDTATALGRWLLLEGPACASLGVLVEGYTARLHASGIPADRAFLGQVRRGDAQTITAAICFSDMRGFTRLSAAHPRDTVVSLLNETFTALVEHIEAHGGQVLKFMGDGMLAVFIHPDPARACAAALQAVTAAQRVVEDLGRARQATGEPTAGVGFGLHHGDVTYGNIGAPGRLDFTVIGPAVNLTARIEALCSRLQQPVLVSADFAEHISVPLRSCGHHAMKGATAPAEIFAPFA